MIHDFDVGWVSEIYKVCSITVIYVFAVNYQEPVIQNMYRNTSKGYEKEDILNTK